MLLLKTMHQLGSKEIDLHVAELPSGMYVLRIVKENEIEFKKISIQH